MGKKKLIRFEENKISPHVVEPLREDLISGKFDYRGKWNAAYFKKNQPIVLELGCGKGEYTIGLANRFTDKNFIGIDIKGSRFWFGAKQAQEEKMDNVAFLRTQIELIPYVFAPGEVSEIWITFPDPQIKYRRAKHRLTHPFFLERYKQVLVNGGFIHLKTDSEFLHGYTHGILQAMNHRIFVSSHNIYHPSATHESIAAYVKNIQTHYEKMFLAKGKPITYIQFSLNHGGA